MRAALTRAVEKNNMAHAVVTAVAMLAVAAVVDKVAEMVVEVMEAPVKARRLFFSPPLTRAAAEATRPHAEGEGATRACSIGAQHRRRAAVRPLRTAAGAGVGRLLLIAACSALGWRGLVWFGLVFACVYLSEAS